jgi:tetrahydromethanopterin S-methyltransferase subunit B
MNADPDQLLNRFVVAALTLFIAVSLLLAAFVFREIWLQQRIADLSVAMEVNLEDLEETTKDIQSELSVLDTITATGQQAENLEEVTALLADANEQLTSLEQEINEVTTILEPATGGISTATPAAEIAPTAQNRADQVFTIFAILVGVAAIAIAILLTMAVRVQQTAASRREPRS